MPLCNKYSNLRVYACDFAKSAVDIILVYFENAIGMGLSIEQQ